ncbi:MAG TPA: uridine diphosphate-N-acetylglucosamine-binding protein YvcK [Thermoanaerobaculia bacterium]|nr:uridine diphosphate-N-acetylglucosamine-binding protein YvcK [Thermoanaerobaculia bacterium]
MPTTTPTSPSSARTGTTAISSASPEAAGGPVLVAVGGGTGLSALLRGLKHHVGSERLRELTGVVTVTDDGGSSGRLRREFGVLPPGDIRNCIVALADDEDLLARLFQYRFPNGGGLLGHSFGNLFLTALTGITGDFYQAILTAESILSVRGKIYPATLTDLHLRGHGVSGAVYEGESAVGGSGEELARIELDPGAPPAFPAAAAALGRADLILLGPGSLYTSILPNLLIPGIRQAIAESRRRGARVVLLLNLMTQPGETDGMMGPDHLRAIQRHAAADLVDAVLVNATPIPPELLALYAETRSQPVAAERASLEEMGVEVETADLLAAGDLIRHDPEKLARAVLGLVERA